MSFLFPFGSLSGDARELGLIVAIAIGFGFGFVLERAGFGRAQKLAAQFYGNDMTVFKVMFSGIVTAMLGAVVLSGLGLMDLRAVSDVVTSNTYLWPMVLGGFLLGIGFIVSGYCPGTSAVAMASGKVDGLFTVIGVIAGTIAYSELQPSLASFHGSSDYGHLYLYDLVHLPPAVVAGAVAVMAVAMFVGAEKIEKLVARAPVPPPPPRPKRVAWAGFGVGTLAGLATLLVPVRGAAVESLPTPMSAQELTRRALEAPWTLRILDLRSLDECGKSRVPSAECVPEVDLKNLQLQDAAPVRDLVLVASGELTRIPPAARGYKGRIYALAGGFDVWRQFALVAPEPLAATATPAEREAYRLRSGIQAALTGVPQAPPPPPPAAGAIPAKKKAGGGGCGG